MQETVEDGSFFCFQVLISKSSCKNNSSRGCFCRTEVKFAIYRYLPLKMPICENGAKLGYFNVKNGAKLPYINAENGAKQNCLWMETMKGIECTMAIFKLKMSHYVEKECRKRIEYCY